MALFLAVSISFRAQTAPHSPAFLHCRVIGQHPMVCHHPRFDSRHQIRQVIHEFQG